MSYLIICLAAFLASGLTLFSGFGLGTILLPVMVLFFPIDLAIAFTAVVHALNNLFKCWLLGRHADQAVVVKFGLPAILSALLGAWALLYLSDLAPLLTYQFGGREAHDHAGETGSGGADGGLCPGGTGAPGRAVLPAVRGICPWAAC